MQTIAVQVQDNYLKEFMNYINENSSNLSISKNNNSSLDPYFYDRQKKLHEIRDDIKSDNIQLLNEVEADREIQQFFQNLENI